MFHVEHKRKFEYLKKAAPQHEYSPDRVCEIFLNRLKIPLRRQIITISLFI
jgi:hypothetical protein